MALDALLPVGGEITTLLAGVLAAGSVGNQLSLFSVDIDNRCRTDPQPLRSRHRDKGWATKATTLRTRPATPSAKDETRVIAERRCRCDGAQRRRATRPPT